MIRQITPGVIYYYPPWSRWIKNVSLGDNYISSFINNTSMCVWVKMKLKNTILVQVTLYIVIFFHSLFIIIPLSIYSSQFNEHCLLYASGKWQFPVNKSDPQILTVMWSDKSLCNYSTAIGFISLFVSLAYVVWFSTLLFRIHDQLVNFYYLL